MALSKQTKRKRKEAGFEQEAPTCYSCVHRDRRPTGLVDAGGKEILSKFCTELGFSLLSSPRGLCNNWKDKHGNTLE